MWRIAAHRALACDAVAFTREHVVIHGRWSFVKSRVMQSAFGGLVIVLVLALGVSAAGAGVVRWVDPGLPAGTTTCTDIAAPCSLPAALDVAQPGDTVVLTSGVYSLYDYELPSIDDRLVVTTPSLTIVGGSVPAYADSAPTLYGGGGLEIRGAGDVVRNLLLPASSLFVDAPATIDRVDVFTDHGDACHIVSNNVLVLNSNCQGVMDGLYAEGSNIVLRNVTAVGRYKCGVEASGDFPGGYTPPVNSVTMVNTIARLGADGDADLCITRVGHAVKVMSRNSSYTSVDESGSETELITSSIDDLTAAPLLVDEGYWDVHEDPQSPTVGAGMVDPANGTTDLWGSPRVSACTGVTDIGAYQVPDSTLCP
jgi:hypothetical protein